MKIATGREFHDRVNALLRMVRDRATLWQWKARRCDARSRRRRSVPRCTWVQAFATEARLTLRHVEVEGNPGARRPLAGLRRTAEAEERPTAVTTALFDGPPGVEL